jgi:hypothetical protein
MNCFRSLKFSVVAGAALLHVAFSCASTFETWQKTEDSALAATKAAHFLDAEKLLLANQKLCETFPPKDARLPRTLFDLAQVWEKEMQSMGVHTKACLIGCSLGALAVSSYFLLSKWVAAGLILAPGYFVAVILHTPDIHGGTGFIRTVLVANFLLYALLVATAAELWLRWRRSRQAQPPS